MVRNKETCPALNPPIMVVSLHHNRLTDRSISHAHQYQEETGDPPAAAEEESSSSAFAGRCL
jgi:hypothetical protein